VGVFVMAGGRAGVDVPASTTDGATVDEAADDKDGVEAAAAATVPRSQGFGGEPMVGGGEELCGDEASRRDRQSALG
jgi:hypothetical protein